MWLCSVVRSWATQDNVNRDYVCTLTTSPGMNRPLHPDHHSHAPSSKGHETRLALKDSFLEQGTPREEVYCKIWRIRRRGKTKEYYRRGRSVTAGKTAGVARSGAGVTRRTRDHYSQRRAGRCAQEWKPGAPPENVSDDIPK